MKHRHFLPHQGGIDLAEFAAALSRAPRLLNLPDEIEVRSILLPGDGAPRLTHAGTVAHLGVREATEPEQASWGRAQVLRLSACASDCVDPRLLAEILGFWSQQATEPARFSSVSLSWYRSRSQWAQEPCWVARLGIAGNVDCYATAELSDPFFSVECGWVADDFAHLAKTWLKAPLDLRDRNFNNDVYVVIPDRRGFLSDLSFEGGQIHVCVAGAGGSNPILTISASDAEGEGEHQMLEMPDRQRTIALRRTPQELKIRLWTSAGELLDEYTETAARSSWGRSILAGRRRRAGPSDHALDAAIEEGEGERVEFKTFVPLHRRDDKLREFIESSVAFANAGGGTIFIGVTDHAQIVDITRRVFEALKEHSAEGQVALRARYVRELQRVLSETTAPEIRATFEWLERANSAVLQVRITEGTEKPYEIVEGHHFYVRRNATNRRMSRAELLLTLRRR